MKKILGNKFLLTCIVMLYNNVLFIKRPYPKLRLIAAARCPARIKGILLEGAHSIVEDYGKASVLESRERAKNTNLLKNLEKFHDDKTSELFRLWHETWLDPRFSDWTIVPLLLDIQCPVLAFQGERDEFGTTRQLTILKENIPSEVTIAEIPNAAHTPHKEASEETMGWIKYFFENHF